MRVLHVNDYAPGYDRGGVEVYLDRLIGAQRAAGDEVQFFAAEPASGAARRLLDVWNPREGRRLRQAVAAFRPDVIHVHNVVRELSPAVLRPTGVPTVMTAHDLRLVRSTEHTLPDPRAVVSRLWLEPSLRRFARRLPAVLGVGEALVADLRRVGFGNAELVPVPVPEPLVPPRPVELCHDVVFVGKLAPDKGAHVLREAFLAMADRHPEAALVIVGDGPERERLASPDPRVVLKGRLDPVGVSRIMGSARVVVVPSIPGLRREGSPTTAIEAARHGRPLVVSDDPGAAETARRVGGDVVPAGDVAALAARLDHWLSSPSEAAAAGERAANAARDRHAPKAVAAQLREVYRRAREVTHR